MKFQKEEKTDAFECMLLKSVANLNESFGFIHDYSERMDSIAMNASIEAARSHNHSETFNNVADQLHHQVQFLEKIKDKFKTQCVTLLDDAMNLLGSSLSDTAGHIEENLVDHLQKIANLCNKMSEEMLASFDIKDISQNNDRQMVEQMYKSVVKYLDHEDWIFNQMDEVVGFQLIQNNGINLLCKYKKSIDFPSGFHIRLPLDDRVKGGFISCSNYKPGCHKIGYLSPLLSPDQEPRGFALYIIDVHQILGKTTLNYSLMDGKAVVHPNGHGVVLRDHAKTEDNFSWMNLFTGISEQKQGYSLESYKNGWSASWGYFPLRLPAAFSKDQCISFLVWNFIRFPARTFSSQSFDIESSTDHSLFDKMRKDFLGVAAKINETLSEYYLISEQVNMLAVNAAIQASMAGVEGKAFGVIAEQVGRLSNLLTSFQESLEEKYFNIDQSLECISGKYLQNLGQNLVYSVNNQLETMSDLIDDFSLRLNQETDAPDDAKILEILEKHYKDSIHVSDAYFIRNSKVVSENPNNPHLDLPVEVNELYKNALQEDVAYSGLYTKDGFLYFECVYSLSHLDRGKDLYLYTKFGLRDLRRIFVEKTKREQIQLRLKDSAANKLIFFPEERAVDSQKSNPEDEVRILKELFAKPSGIFGKIQFTLWIEMKYPKIKNQNLSYSLLKSAA